MKIFLIVAHDTNNRKKLEDLLVELGYDFRSVVDDAAALMMLKHWRFDGMVLDVDPQGGDYHFEVRQFLHERGVFLPTLLVVGSEMHNNVEGLVKDQRTESELYKPIQQEELWQWLIHWVGPPQSCCSL